MMPRPSRPARGSLNWDTYVESVFDDVYGGPAGTAAPSATYLPQASPQATGGFGLGQAPTARIPHAASVSLSPGLAGSSNKIGHYLATTVTGDLSTDTGTDPTFAFGLNVFSITGPAANDGKGGTLQNLIEYDVQAASGTITLVTGLQAEASFYGAVSGATVTHLESMRVASPKRKSGATGGTATNAYGLFIESFDGSAVGATNAFALFVEGGLSRFQGRVDVDSVITSSGQGRLELYANFTRGQGASLWVDGNSSGYSTGNIFAQLSKAGSALVLRDNSDVTRFSADNDAPASGNTTLQVSYHNGTAVALGRVTVGAADSGGAGYRLLRVAN